jgi:hypothetical protein
MGLGPLRHSRRGGGRAKVYFGCNLKITSALANGWPVLSRMLRNVG